MLSREQARDLKLVDGAELMGVSDRQSKRLWKRYRDSGAKGLQHRSAGGRSHRAMAAGFRVKGLGLVRRK